MYIIPKTTFNYGTYIGVPEEPATDGEVAGQLDGQGRHGQQYTQAQADPHILEQAATREAKLGADLGGFLGTGRTFLTLPDSPQKSPKA